jgi:hypothetical protein
VSDDVLTLRLRRASVELIQLALRTEASSLYADDSPEAAKECERLARDLDEPLEGKPATSKMKPGEAEEYLQQCIDDAKRFRFVMSISPLLVASIAKGGIVQSSHGPEDWCDALADIDEAMRDDAHA